MDNAPTKPTLHFSMDARSLVSLGRESIKDDTTAVIELVKNSWDADATEVLVSFGSDGESILIADNGTGMTRQVIERHFLTIGFSEKLVNPQTSRKRRKTGEKGIGRLSAARLGSRLEMSTKSEDQQWGLQIDWDDFEVSGRRVEDVPLTLEERPAFREFVSTASGTEMYISQTRTNWTREKYENLWEELSILTSPLKSFSDFNIYYSTPFEEFNGLVKSPFLETAPIEVNATLTEKKLDLQIIDRVGKKVREKHESISWQQVLQFDDNSELRDNLIAGTHVHLLLFVRRNELLVSGFSLSDMREFLNRNAGVKIYRDGFRVKPYGEPGSQSGDWLGLSDRKLRNPQGAGKDTFRVAENQVVGAVQISRDGHPMLGDAASREGLIENEHFEQLRHVTLACIRELETAYHNAFKREFQRPQPSPSAKVAHLTRTLVDLSERLAETNHSGQGELTFEDATESIVEAQKVIEDTSKSLADLEDQAIIFRGLATLGIASAVFAHETQSSISAIKASAKLALSSLTKSPQKIEIAQRELGKIAEFQTRIASWGRFALSRVRRDKRKRKKHDVHKLVGNVASQLEELFMPANVQLRTRLQPISTRVFAMDIEAIVINLLTNAYHASFQTKRDREILLELFEEDEGEERGFKIAVSDSGPGINQAHLAHIWDPLFTTKVSGGHEGTGLGLAIVRSAAIEADGSVSASSNSELGGARIEIWIPRK